MGLFNLDVLLVLYKLIFLFFFLVLVLFLVGEGIVLLKHLHGNVVLSTQTAIRDELWPTALCYCSVTLAK